MTTVTKYYCSECGLNGGEISSEGTEASDHMQQVHGVDPEESLEERQNAPYLIPVESNPTDLPGMEETPGG